MKQNRQPFNYDIEDKGIDIRLNQYNGAQRDATLETAQNLYETMALQMEYTESLKAKKDTRKLKAIEYVEIDPDQSAAITRRLIEIYGQNSIQVEKWVQQLSKIESYRLQQKKAVKKRKRQMVLMAVLSVLGVAIIAGIVIFLLNSTTYFINQGDHYYIYTKNLLGSRDLYYERSVTRLEKEGKTLYYTLEEDSKLYSDIPGGDGPKVMLNDTVSEFAISGGYIYYINADKDSNLYRMKTDGSEIEVVYDKACSNLKISGKTIHIKDTASDSEETIDILRLS